MPLRVSNFAWIWLARQNNHQFSNHPWMVRNIRYPYAPINQAKTSISLSLSEICYLLLILEMCQIIYWGSENTILVLHLLSLYIYLYVKKSYYVIFFIIINGLIKESFRRFIKHIIVHSKQVFFFFSLKSKIVILESSRLQKCF